MISKEQSLSLGGFGGSPLKDVRGVIWRYEGYEGVTLRDEGYTGFFSNKKDTWGLYGDVKDTWGSLAI